ncbi:uncharacterized protein MONBRDRAFT_5623 [Monosiga brevicollis MX1]|uniref:PIN domain-containing protein n=1 Tax=Monosiga brevicollis TaxID=81824 RepID=A9URZ5_MONBE|nr:uncharacterized protein MONBRDRAFT_5623 [Monosiga brevicollis MX1]EDQ92013.1 predicted protein [Monosiga brevicollis MX1]|eukprot:XP_001743299.1 hypothetical protein [Monosiga brevicollis MX1]
MAGRGGMLNVSVEARTASQRPSDRRHARQSTSRSQTGPARARAPSRPMELTTTGAGHADMAGRITLAVKQFETEIQTLLKRLKKHVDASADAAETNEAVIELFEELIELQTQRRPRLLHAVLKALPLLMGDGAVRLIRSLWRHSVHVAVDWFRQHASRILSFQLAIRGLLSEAAIHWEAAARQSLRLMRRSRVADVPRPRQDKGRLHRHGLAHHTWLGGRGASAPSMQAALLVYHELLLAMADVARYRAVLTLPVDAEAPSVETLQQHAEVLYSLAARVHPNAGRSFVALAGLHARRGRHLDVLFNYMRSLCIKQPVESSRDALVSMLASLSERAQDSLATTHARATAGKTSTSASESSTNISNRKPVWLRPRVELQQALANCETQPELVEAFDERGSSNSDLHRLTQQLAELSVAEVVKITMHGIFALVAMLYKQMRAEELATTMQIVDAGLRHVVGQHQGLRPLGRNFALKFALLTPWLHTVPLNQGLEPVSEVMAAVHLLSHTDIILSTESGGDGQAFIAAVTDLGNLAVVLLEFALPRWATMLTRWWSEGDAPASSTAEGMSTATSATTTAATKATDQAEDAHQAQAVDVHEASGEEVEVDEEESPASLRAALLRMTVRNTGSSDSGDDGASGSDEEDSDEDDEDDEEEEADQAGMHSDFGNEDSGSDVTIQDLEDLERADDTDCSRQPQLHLVAQLTRLAETLDVVATLGQAMTVLDTWSAMAGEAKCHLPERFYIRGLRPFRSLSREWEHEWYRIDLGATATKDWPSPIARSSLVVVRLFLLVQRMAQLSLERPDVLDIHEGRFECRIQTPRSHATNEAAAAAVGDEALCTSDHARGSNEQDAQTSSDQPSGGDEDEQPELSQLASSLQGELDRLLQEQTEQHNAFDDALAQARRTADLQWVVQPDLLVLDTNVLLEDKAFAIWESVLALRLFTLAIPITGNDAFSRLRLLLCARAFGPVKRFTMLAFSFVWFDPVLSELEGMAQDSSGEFQRRTAAAQAALSWIQAQPAAGHPVQALTASGQLFATLTNLHEAGARREADNNDAVILQGARRHQDQERPDEVVNVAQRKYLLKRVAIVTGDRNLQLRSRAAGVAALDLGTLQAQLLAP